MPTICFIAFDVGTPTLNPGQAFSFSGIIVIMTRTRCDLNNIDVTLDGSLFQVDLSPFFSGPLTVGPEATTLPFALFSVTVDLPYTVPPGDTNGNLTILGGVEIGGDLRSDGTGFPGLGSVQRECSVYAGNLPRSR